jgi:hypothetical protein
MRWTHVEQSKNTGTVRLEHLQVASPAESDVNRHITRFYFQHMIVTETTISEVSLKPHGYAFSAWATHENVSDEQRREWLHSSQVRCQHSLVYWELEPGLLSRYCDWAPRCITDESEKSFPFSEPITSALASTEFRVHRVPGLSFQR